MSVIIEELKLKNFEGYKEAELKFYEGLNLIRGRNSTGKSTLLDGLVFALFGEALDVKPRLLVSRLPGSRVMSTYIKFRSPLTRDVVEVERKGRLDSKGAYRTEERKLQINGDEVQTESDGHLRARIVELMGISLRKFLNLVYVKQDKLIAILEPPKEQMDSVIGITMLRELREQTDEARKHLEVYDGKDAATEARSLEGRVIPNLMSDLGLVKNDIDSLRMEVQRLEDLVWKGESPELTELLEQIQEKEETERKMAELDVRVRELLRKSECSSPDELELKTSSWRKRLEDLKSTKSVAAEKVEVFLNAWSTFKGQADVLEDQIKEHKSLLQREVSKCPTCGQDLNSAILQKMLEEDSARLEESRSSESRARETYEKKKSDLDQLNEEIVNTENIVQTLNLTKDDLKRYLDSAGEIYRTRERLHLRIRDTLGRLGLSLEPEDSELKVKVAQQLPIHPEELAKKRKDLDEKQKVLQEKISRMRELEGEMESSKELLAKLKLRVDRAKLTRSLSQRFDQGVEEMRKEFLRRIEWRALEYYKTMTDQHVYSAITIDPDEYTVWVRPKGLAEPIPATRVGGGHQSLLALSVRLALLDALGFRSLLILDEPTYGVDAENLPQLASHIGEASRQLSQMILVTHHNICDEEASNIIDVTIREDGASSAEVRL